MPKEATSQPCKAGCAARPENFQTRSPRVSCDALTHGPLCISGSASILLFNCKPTCLQGFPFAITRSRLIDYAAPQVSIQEVVPNGNKRRVQFAYYDTALFSPFLIASVVAQAGYKEVKSTTRREAFEVPDGRIAQRKVKSAQVHARALASRRLHLINAHNDFF